MKLFELCFFACAALCIRAVPLHHHAHHHHHHHHHHHPEVYHTASSQDYSSSSPSPHPSPLHHYYKSQQPPPYRRAYIHHIEPQTVAKLQKFDHITGRLGDILSKIIHYHRKVKEEEEIKEKEEENEPTLLDVLIENPRIVQKIKDGTVTYDDVERIRYDDKNDYSKNNYDKEYSSKNYLDIKKNDEYYDKNYDNDKKDHYNYGYSKYQNFDPNYQGKSPQASSSEDSSHKIELPNKKDAKSIQIWKIRSDYHPAAGTSTIENKMHKEATTTEKNH